MGRLDRVRLAAVLTRIKIIGSGVAVACALAAAQSAPPAHAEQTVEAAHSLRNTVSAASADWPWPVIGEVVTAYRNGDDPYAAGQHRGVDIAAPVGTPARAVVAGNVSFSGRIPDGGNVVTVRTSDGEYLVSYLHLATRAVQRGASVKVGETLGTTGTTGRRSISAPHLHLGVRIATTRAYVDPMSLLGEPRLAAPATGSPERGEISQPLPQRTAQQQANVKPLEQSTRLNATAPSERAGRQTGSERPSSAAADEIARPARTAAAKVSVEAPEPIELESDAIGAEEDGRDRVISAPNPIDARARQSERVEDNRIPLRSILFALAVLALVGLFLNRRSQATLTASLPPQSSPSQPDADADVVALDVIRAPRSEASHGRARGGRP